LARDFPPETPYRPATLAEEPRMQIDERSVGNVKVLDLSGRIAGQGDTLFKDKIHSIVTQGHKRILINMAGVTYMDSAGLGELVSAFTTVKRSGGSVKFQVTGKIKDLLTITRLVTVFETFDMEQDAIKSFN
jgi:anti-sigma B factor antagonist